MVPWPDGRMDLKIVSLWPAKGKYKPDVADYLAVKNGRIYLSFAAGQFIAVLDGKTGAYLQTIVGAPPGAVGAVATKSNTDDKPDGLIDADFVVTAVKGEAIGKLLLAHDPLWLLASEMTPLDAGERISALTVIGDEAKTHAHDIFVALGPPVSEVEARSALDSDVVTYRAGKPGGRGGTGVWQGDRLGEVRGVAFDGQGQLWVAEGEGRPKRVSVWTTDGREGRLVREFFAPPDSAGGVAIDPLDPLVLVADGCEWRIDPETGRAGCAGVITRERYRAARFVAEGDHLLLVITGGAGREVALERVGDGVYRKHAGAGAVGPEEVEINPTLMGSWRVVTRDGFDLGTIFNPVGIGWVASVVPMRGGGMGAGPGAVTRTGDGRVFFAAARGRVWDFELAGMETLRPLVGGEITVGSRAR